MTLPDERTRAILNAGGFLIEIAQDQTLPIEVRRRAVAIARHFPTFEDVAFMAMFSSAGVQHAKLASPKDILPGDVDCHFGFLSQSTRLGWPELY